MSRHNRKRRQQRKELPNYAASVLDLYKQSDLKPGCLYTIDVLHDGWCDLLAGKGLCNCNPEVHAPKRVPSPLEN